MTEKYIDFIEGAKFRLATLHNLSESELTSHSHPHIMVS